jgi:cytochrome P450 family 135
MAVASSPVRLPPGPGGIPGMNDFRWIFRPVVLQDNARKRYGNIWSLKLLRGEQWVLVSAPDLIEQIFKTDPKVLHGGEGNSIAVSVLGPRSLLLLDEDEHLRQRKVMRPFLYGERLDHYPELMASICEEEVATWPMNEAFPLLPRLEAIAVKIIMKVIFGMRGGPHQAELLARARRLIKFGDSQLRMTRYFLMGARNPGNAPKDFTERRDSLDVQVYKELDRARQDPDLENRDDVLAMLLRARYDDGTPLSDPQLRDHLVTLLIQGHQSTATTLAWALERLMRHPEAFEKLRAEAETDSDEYVDAVLKETLRLRPPLPVTMRLVKEPYQLGEYEIQPGVRMAILTYQVHRLPELYPDPEAFRPERWLDGSTQNAMWIPFGGGERHCIGRSFATMVIKVVLRTIALQTRLTPEDPADESIRHRRVQFSPGRNAVAILTERIPTAHANVSPMMVRH